ncbi:MAG: RNA methyltransferase [Eubacterium sp.]|nr:RNA methyltransferase [Eubacterium sp.]
MITSVSNPKIKNLISLKKSARERRKQESFLVEGPRMFFEIPAGQLREVYLTEEFEHRFGDRLAGYRYECISDNVCRHLSDTRTPQGVIAVVRPRHWPLSDLISSAGVPCFMVLENLQDPGNLGTILRTAEAAGVTGIIMNRDCVDPYNPKVIRSTMGAVFRMPFLVVEDLAGALAAMKREGILVYAAHLEGKIFYEEDYKKPAAFLIGNEGNGLTDETASLADRLIRIPMKGNTESLNAAMAAGLIMYEVMRQRDWS